MNKARPRLVVSFLVAIAFTTLADAQPKSIPAAKHSLWKIQSGTNQIYLLGSVHVLKKTDYPLAGIIETTYTNCPAIGFEADLGEVEDPAMAMKLLSKGRLPEGETLEKRLSPEVYRMFTNHVADSGLPLFVFERFTPALAAMTLAVLELQKLGLQTEYGVDKHFYQLAKAAGKEIIPLETVEFQMSLLTDFSKEEGELVMKTTLKEMDQMKTELDTIVRAWKSGDSEKLERLLNEATKEAPKIYKRLLTDRNARWIPKLEELLKTGKTTLVIVGAGHLVGKEGVVELLMEKGFKATQL